MGASLKISHLLNELVDGRCHNINMHSKGNIKGDDSDCESMIDDGESVVDDGE